ncbi:MAG: LamB/YcsF family protein [Tistlia sp.]|uniref:LamB/YcsF family protein n=1 Tax=Tistlia sp. TaxID=3057121 RepID=UPI0034A13AAF
MPTMINCDMGESFGLYRMGDDEGMMPLITAANVACGFHASDFNHMRKTVRLARQHGVRVGAHPSLPDLQGFGRREMKIEREELANCLIYQVGALKGFLEAEGMTLNHIKPHGALYGMAARLEPIAQAVADVADIFRVPLYGMVNCLHEEVYKARGHQFVGEYYADLEYADDGGLLITREHEAVDPERAAQRSLTAIKEGTTTSVGGKTVRVGSDTICVHSDTPNAVAVAARVRETVKPYLAAA